MSWKCIFRPELAAKLQEIFPKGSEDDNEDVWTVAGRKKRPWQKWGPGKTDSTILDVMVDV